MRRLIHHEQCMCSAITLRHLQEPWEPAEWFQKKLIQSMVSRPFHPDLNYSSRKLRQALGGVCLALKNDSIHISGRGFKEKPTGASYQEKSSISRSRKPDESLSSPLCQYPSCYTCEKARQIWSGVNSSRATARNMIDRLRALKGLNIPCYKVAIYSPSPVL